jgi:outer membrane protein assembly factor BamE (lipoprotein component of BamABCDE complex)
MIRNMKIKLLLGLLTVVVLGLSLSANANVQAQKGRAAFNHEETAQQPLYTEYKGVQLGMSADEVRAKLGTPALKESDQDYYMFSQNETAQMFYNAAHKVVTISVDYVGGSGAPDYKTVVGAELEK